MNGESVPFVWHKDVNWEVRGKGLLGELGGVRQVSAWEQEGMQLLHCAAPLTFFFFLPIDSLDWAYLQPAGFSLGLLGELLCVMMPFVKCLASKACSQLWIVLNCIQYFIKYSLLCCP